MTNKQIATWGGAGLIALIVLAVTLSGGDDENDNEVAALTPSDTGSESEAETEAPAAEAEEAPADAETAEAESEPAAAEGEAAEVENTTAASTMADPRSLCAIQSPAPIAPIAASG